MTVKLPMNAPLASNLAGTPCAFGNSEPTADAGGEHAPAARRSPCSREMPPPELNDVYAFCLQAREMAQPGFPSAGSAGTCLFASVFLQQLLEKFGGCRCRVRGGDGVADGGAVDAGGFWRGHYWVEGATAEAFGFVADITSDQFGWPAVVVLPLEQARDRYRPGNDAVVDEGVAEARRVLGMDTYEGFPEPLARVAAFLHSIGLRVHVEVGAQGFVSGVRIRCGELHVDPACPPSTLLHEAAHLAIVPQRFRHLMSDNLSVGMKEMFRQIEEMGLEPDAPLQRAAIQCSDPEATAWAWAAGLAVGLDPEQIICDNQYDGTGADLRLALSANCWAGINGLAHAGFCTLRRDAKEGKFPHLLFWTQDL